MAFKTISVILAAGALAPAAVVYAQEDAAPLHERTALTDVPLEGPRAAMQPVSYTHLTLPTSDLV